MLFQRSDGRVGDPQVPPARHSGRSASRSSSDLDPQVPGEQWYHDVVQDIHVGRHLSTVRQLTFTTSNFDLYLLQL